MFEELLQLGTNVHLRLVQGTQDGGTRPGELCQGQTWKTSETLERSGSWHPLEQSDQLVACVLLLAFFQNGPWWSFGGGRELFEGMEGFLIWVKLKNMNGRRDTHQPNRGHSYK